MKKLQCADLYHDPLKEEDSGSRSHVYFATEPFMEGVSEPRPHELTLGCEHLRILLLLLLHWVSLRWRSLSLSSVYFLFSPYF